MNREHRLRVKVRYSNGKYLLALAIKRAVERVDGILTVRLVRFKNGKHKRRIQVCIRYSEGVFGTVERIISVVRNIDDKDKDVVIKTSLLKKRRPSLRRPVNVNIYS